MSWLSNLVGGGIKETVEGISGAIDKFVETPDEKRAAEVLRAKMEQEPHLWQAEINKINAAHRSPFVAGWRPAIGWVCAISLFFFYVPQYFMATWIWVRMCFSENSLVPYPVTDDGLMELVLALLGMGALRGFDKLAGRSK